MFMLLRLPKETPQDEASRVLHDWQIQRKAGIPPEKREIPDDAFSRDLAPIREAIDRPMRNGDVRATARGRQS